MFLSLRNHFKPGLLTLFVSARHCVTAIKAPFGCASVSYLLDNSFSFIYWTNVHVLECISPEQNIKYLVIWIFRRKKKKLSVSSFTRNSREDACQRKHWRKYAHTQSTAVNDSLEKVYERHGCISRDYWFSKYNKSHVLKNWESTEITVW